MRGVPARADAGDQPRGAGLAGEVAWRVPLLAVPTRATPAVADRVWPRSRPCSSSSNAPGRGTRLRARRRRTPVGRRVCRPAGWDPAGDRAGRGAGEGAAGRADCAPGWTSGSACSPAAAASPSRANGRSGPLVDWSYDLLSAEEQTLFDRLSVFAGGFTFEAVQQVCADAGVDEWAVLDVLQHLVDKSLVVADEGESGTERYRLLETLRQYGRERLLASGESDAVHSRHAAFFLALGRKLKRQSTRERSGGRRSRGSARNITTFAKRLDGLLDSQGFLAPTDRPGCGWSLRSACSGLYRDTIPKDWRGPGLP